MIKKTSIILYAAALFSFANVPVAIYAKGVEKNESKNIHVSENAKNLYERLQFDDGVKLPSYEVFATALKGFNNLKNKEGSIKKDMLTVIDFSKSSNEKRLWVIDLINRKVIFHDYVAHGRNSGNEFVKSFSNLPQSYQSSIGFYVTAETYFGKHGLSLRLDGKDKDFNHNARKRAIVMHGADYVSDNFIKKYGRLGRSYGCPSVPMESYKDVIETIKGGSCLFIYYPDSDFLTKSDVLNS